MGGNIRTWLEEHQGQRTLLGICPMSDEIVNAAVSEAADTGFVPMFIATPRQVDADRGYTGWSQSELVDYICDACDRYGYDGPYLVARDHGGPYQSMRDRDDPSVELDDAMAYAREMFSRDVAAGFDILHVDATKDPRVDGPLELAEVARRTAELVRAIEEQLEQMNDRSDEVYYEVGTEEVHGGMTDPTDFERYLDLLEDELDDEYGDALERLLFIVGQVGTTMRIDMTNQFDADQAETLVNRASSHELFLKVHYTDWLETTTLERFPELGIGAANVGPEFAAAIVTALAELERIETHRLRAVDALDRKSDFVETMERVAVERAPWEKFAPEDLNENELDEFAEANREDISLCVGRYVLTEPAVREARKKLYANLREHSAIDPDRYVVEHVTDSIDRYVDAFGLSAMPSF